MWPLFFEESFDYINSTESRFMSPVMQEKNLIVLSEQLCLLLSHPVYQAFPRGEYFVAQLVFRNVRKSVRKIREYIDDSKNPVVFKEIELVDDGPFPHSNNCSGLREYGMEGTLVHPTAWIHDWVIVAESFSLEVRGPAK